MQILLQSQSDFCISSVFFSEFIFSILEVKKFRPGKISKHTYLGAKALMKVGNRDQQKNI
jgi:hypothetical protein